jgi:hypothetical protein
MELDALKQRWAEQDRKLDACIRLNRDLLIAGRRNRVQSPLRRFAFSAGFGALSGLIGTMVLGSFIYDNLAEPRFALPAVLLHVWMIATLAASIRQMAMALRIDYDQPIAAIQKQIESVRILRIRVTRWALLTGQLVWWIPFLIVALKGFWGLDAYKLFGAAFLLANLAAGLAIIPLAIWVAKKFSGRLGKSPLMQRLMRDVAGHNLNAATDFLTALAAFDNEGREI